MEKAGWILWNIVLIGFLYSFISYYEGGDFSPPEEVYTAIGITGGAFLSLYLIGLAIKAIPVNFALIGAFIFMILMSFKSVPVFLIGILIMLIGFIIQVGTDVASKEEEGRGIKNEERN
ncbi:hypothetical protein [Persephonella sp. KM09-Lau-8]|uniref:hypothetical protein n=1 Tax=Persephonella sp. KM09-Lau-8 TaxID=1158345 RepID=UPI000495C5AF|nr:hypothetical protein [Persephonella sp. KM09-Lau-8]